VVGLAGPSGAGKTVFSTKVRSFLPGTVHLQMDMYNDGTKVVDNNFDDPRLTDYDTLLANISDLRAGKTVQVRQLRVRVFLPPPVGEGYCLSLGRGTVNGFFFFCSLAHSHHYVAVEASDVPADAASGVICCLSVIRYGISTWRKPHPRFVWRDAASSRSVHPFQRTAVRLLGVPLTANPSRAACCPSR
jgi:hypothetical protein